MMTDPTEPPIPLPDAAATRPKGAPPRLSEILTGLAEDATRDRISVADMLETMRRRDRDLGAPLDHPRL